MIRFKTIDNGISMASRLEKLQMNAIGNFFVTISGNEVIVRNKVTGEVQKLHFAPPAKKEVCKESIAESRVAWGLNIRA